MMLNPSSKPGRVVAFIVLIIPASYPLLAALSALLQFRLPSGITSAIGIATLLLTFIVWRLSERIGVPTWALILVIAFLGIISNIAACEYDPHRKRYGPQ